MGAVGRRLTAVGLGLVFLALLRDSAGATERARWRFEGELAAWRAAGGPVSFHELERAPVPDDRNAAVLYRRAFEPLRRQPLAWRDLANIERCADPAAALAPWGESIRLVREAAGLADCVWATDIPEWERGPFMSDLHGVLLLGKLVRADAWVRAGEGDAAAAIEDIEASLELAADQLQEPHSMFFLIGCSAEQRALQTLRDLFSERDGDFTRIDAILAGRDYPRGFAGMCWGWGAEWMSHPWWTRPGSPRTWDGRAWLLRCERAFRDRVLREWWEGPPEPEVAGEAPPWGQTHVNGMVRAMIMVPYCRAWNSLARTAIRLRAGGRPYPDSIDAPVDPFDGRPIRYRRDGEGFILWSVGTNGVDDGGYERDDVVWRWAR